MLRTLSVAILLFVSQFAFAQQFAGTGSGKLVFGQSGTTHEYRSLSLFSNISFYTGKISFHFKTSTFLPVNNSDPNLVNEVFDAGLKGAMEFSGTIPAGLKTLKIKETINTVLKGHMAYGNVKKPIDIPVKLKRVAENKYELLSSSLLSLPALGISPQSATYKKTDGVARLLVDVILQNEL